MVSLLSVVVAIACVMSMAIFLAILFRRRVLETVFISSGLIILTLFGFGLLGFSGCLLIGYWVVIGLSVAAATISAHALYQRKALIGEIDLWQGVIVVGAFSLLSLFLNYNRWFISWDEFSHWGIIVKHMYSLDALGTFSGERLLYPSYFPGVSLFEYFFTRANPTFVEYPVFVASSFLFFSMAVTFIKKIHIRTVLFVLAFVLFPILISQTASAAFLSNILVDGMIGCLFGFSLVIYLQYMRNRNSLFAVVLFSTTLSVLAISKDIGIALALLAMGICVVDVVLYRRKEISHFFSSSPKGALLRRPIVIAPLSMTILPWLLFKLNVALSGVKASWESAGAGDLLTGHLKEYQIKVIQDFWNNTFTAPEPPIPISFFGLMVVFLALLVGWSVVMKNRVAAKRLVTMGALLFVGFFIYSALIMILYLLVFSEYEAARLASYSRYMGTYLIGFSIFFAGALLFETKPAGRLYKKYRDTVMLVGFFGAVALGGGLHWAAGEGGVLYDVAHARQEVVKTINARASYEVAKQWRLCLNNQNDKLNIIATNTKGNERNILLYTLYPIAAQTYYKWDYSIGEKPYNAGDIWTLVASPVAWHDYVNRNYTLVYVFTYDDAFKQSYGQYFDELRNNQLYKVEVTSGKLVLRSIAQDSCLVTTQ